MFNSEDTTKCELHLRIGRTNLSRENIAIRKTKLTHSQVTPAQVAVVQTPDIWLSAIDQDDMIPTVLICIASRR